MTKRMSIELRKHFDLALRTSKEAQARGDLKAAWQQLERAHVISQMWISPHMLTHWLMLKLGWVMSDGREVIGQALRMLLVVPGTLLDRLPIGNTGGSNVSVFTHMPVPEDIRSLLENNQAA